LLLASHREKRREVIERYRHGGSKKRTKERLQASAKTVKVLLLIAKQKLQQSTLNH
jgi:DNA-binding CsgD family transcriptional regulator